VVSIQSIALNAPPDLVADPIVVTAARVHRAESAFEVGRIDRPLCPSRPRRAHDGDDEHQQENAAHGGATDEEGVSIPRGARDAAS